MERLCCVVFFMLLSFIIFCICFIYSISFISICLGVLFLSYIFFLYCLFISIFVEVHSLFIFSFCVFFFFCIFEVLYLSFICILYFRSSLFVFFHYFLFSKLVIFIAFHDSICFRTLICLICMTISTSCVVLFAHFPNTNRNIIVNNYLFLRKSAVQFDNSELKQLRIAWIFRKLLDCATWDDRNLSLST